MKRTRKTFSPEFKLEAAQLVLDQGYTYREACEALDIGRSNLENWVRQVRKERNGDSVKGSALTPDQRRIKELERQLKKVEQEKEILKKASALLMSDSLNSSR